MTDEFNYKMSTKYKPEFKSKLKDKQLHETINKERNGTEKDSFDAKEIFTRRDDSGIINKLKKQLNFDIKAYADKSDEEKFNVLKLLYFIINTNKYDEYNNGNESKTVSVINLMSKPSLEHTDFANSKYEEHFKNIIKEIRPVVNNSDYREDTVNKIHQLWKQHHININCTALEDIQLRNNELQKINQRLKSILDSIDRNRICKLQRINEGVIDTFYNMLISSRIIAEIEDSIKVNYNYKNDAEITPSLIDLSMDNSFSNSMDWNEFENLIDIEKADINNSETNKIWSLLLYKDKPSDADFDSINLPSYRFAKKYAKTIAEYWVSESYSRNYVTLGEWITVMQELMYIHSNKSEYSNCFIRHTNPKVKLTAAIKNFDQSSKLPRLIILSHLTNRMLLTFGTKELFEEKLQAYRYIMEIEKIIFSYQNIDDIKTAHNYLFFQISSMLTTDSECSDIPYIINSKINSKLSANNINPTVLMPDCNANLDCLIHILARDKTYRLTQNKDFMELRQKWSNNSQSLLKLFKEYKSINFSVNTSDILAKKIADEIKYIYNNFYPFIIKHYTSSIITIPIYYGEDNKYYCYIKFKFHSNFNAIEISSVSFIGQDIKSFDSYKQLLLY